VNVGKFVVVAVRTEDLGAGLVANPDILPTAAVSTESNGAEGKTE
jgi:hypothetical protein